MSKLAHFWRARSGNRFPTLQNGRATAGNDLVRDAPDIILDDLTVLYEPDGSNSFRRGSIPLPLPRRTLNVPSFGLSKMSGMSYAFGYFLGTFLECVMYGESDSISLGTAVVLMLDG